MQNHTPRTQIPMTLRLAATTLFALLLPATTPAQVPITGVVPITSDTTRYLGTTAEQTTGASVDYQVGDNATFYITGTKASTTISGLVFNNNAAGTAYHFTATASGPNGTGLIMMDGAGSLTAGSGAGAVAYMGAGNNYVTIISGTRDAGGGILTTGTIQNFWANNTHAGGFYIKTGTNVLTLKNLFIVENGAVRTNNAVNGGFISAEDTGRQIINLENVTFKSNRLVAQRNSTTAAAASGGVIAMVNTSGTLSMLNVTFDGNTATGTSSNNAGLAYGGALFFTKGAGNSNTNVTFKNNTAQALGSTGATALGGGLYMKDVANMAYETARFEDNEANATTATGAGKSLGGGIYMEGANARLQMTDVFFARNSATALGVTHEAHGGALYQTSGSSAFTSGTFTANRADDDGGAAYVTGGTSSFTDIVFTSNTATRGGALFLTANGVANVEVSSASASPDTISFGNTAADAASGGFAYLTSSTLNFNVAAGKILTIGSAANTNADTLIGDAASAITFNEAATNTGVIVLHGNNTANASRVNIAAGSVFLGNNNAVLAGDITVADGAAFGGAGTIAPTSGLLAIGDTSTLRVGYAHASVAETLNLTGTLSLANNSILSYGIYDAGSDLLNVGDLLRSGTSTINLNRMGAGTYTLIHSTANLLTSATDNLLTTINGIALGGRQNATYSIFNNTDLQLTLATTNVALTWTGSSGNTWSAATANWTGGDDFFLAGDSAIFTTTGGTTINIVGEIDTSGITVNNTSTLTFAGAGALATGTAGTSITSPTGALTKQGAGTLVLANTATNNFTRGINVLEGTVVGNADTLHTGTPGVTLAASTTLTFNQTANGTYANSINGLATSVVQKTGTASLLLNGNNSAFAGATKIQQGTLIIGGTLGGNVSLDAANTTLAGNGKILGNVTAVSQSALTIGLSHGSLVTGTLTIGGTLNLANNTTLRYDVATGNISDLLLVDALVRTGTSTIDLSTVTSGTYKLISATGTPLVSTDTTNLLTTNNGNSLSARTTTNYFLQSGALWLDIYTGNVSANIWSGTNTGSWREGLDNWSTGDYRYVAGDRVIFDDTAAGTHDIIVDAGSVTVSDMIVNTSGTYRFSGNNAITTSTLGTTLTGTNATGKLTVNGSGLVIFSGSALNNFTNGIVLNSGTLQGNTNSLRATGGIVNNSVLVFNQTYGPGIYNNSITGTGSLVKSGSYPVSLYGAVNYASGLQALEGNLLLLDGATTTKGSIYVASGATLFVRNSDSYTVQNTLTGAGSFYIGLNSTDAEVNFATTSGTAFTGRVYLEKGTFNLSGDNTKALASAGLASIEGNTTIIGSGTQHIGWLALNGGKLIFSATTPGDTVAGGIVEAASSITIASGTVQVSVPATVVNPMTDANLFIQDDGTLVTQLAKANTVTVTSGSVTIVDQTGAAISGSTAKHIDITQGGDTVATGMYNYGLATTSGTDTGFYLNYKLVSLTIAEGKTLNLAPDVGALGTAAIFTATISGSGNLSIDAANAPVTLSANSNFAGTTLLTTGTLIAGANNALGVNSTLVLHANTTLDLNTRVQSLKSLNTDAGSTVLWTTGTLNLAGGAINGALSGAGALNITAGNVVLNGSSPNYSGAAHIAPNASLALNNASALGSSNITFADATSALSFNASANNTFNGTLTGNGSVTFNGTGTTTLAKANFDFTGTPWINGPVVAADTAAFNTAGTVNVSSAGALTYAASGEVGNTIVGSGTLNIANGNVTLAAANTVSHINALAAGNIIVANANALGPISTKIGIAGGTVTFAVDGISVGDVTITNLGRIAFSTPAGAATINSLTANGTGARIVFNTNLEDVTANTLNVTGPMTGAYDIVLKNSGNAPTSDVGTISLINAPNANVTYNLETDSITFADSMTDYAIFLAPGSGGSLGVSIENTTQLNATGGIIVASAGASMPLTWFAELDTIEKRMGDIRLGERRSDRNFDVWARGYTQRLNVNDKPVGTAFHETQYGADAGFDIGSTNKNGASNYIGAFVGYGQTDRDMDGMSASGSTKSIYGGIYFTRITPTGWYFDVVGKYNQFSNDLDAITVGERVTADYDLSAIGASVELGKVFAKNNGWFVQPSVQIAYTHIGGTDYETNTGMKVSLISTNTQQVRGGALLGYKIASKSGGIFQPYAKLNVAQQWTSGGQIIVGTQQWTPTIDGARIDAGIGFNWMPTRRTQLYFDYEYAKAKDYDKPYGLTVGIRYQW